MQGKPTPGGDFAGPRRRGMLPRTIGQLMGLVVLSGLAMGMVVRRDQGATAPAAPRRPVVVPGNVQVWDLERRLQQRMSAIEIDPRFTREAAEVDPRMVVAAPQGIDDRMIVDRNAPRIRMWALPAEPGSER